MHFRDRPPSPGRANSRLTEAYAMHVLPTLDGVMLYLTLRGEHFGTYFGPTEHAAAAAAAQALVESVSHEDEETNA